MEELYFKDYFIEGNSDNDDKKLILVIYDIVDNKRRIKFAKFLEGYGLRVQKSCFEGILSKQMYQRLINSIPFYIGEEDNVRVYKLKVDGEVLSWGNNVDNSDLIII